MALIDCPDCGKQVSSNAPACPSCGAPVASAPGPAPQRGDVVPYTDHEVAVMLSKKKKTSHLLHFFLSLFTIGLWLPIWLLVALVNDIGNTNIERNIAKGKKLW